MIILQVLLALVVLSVLIFVHELGHFLFAKWNKVTVLEFAIGFGRIIWQKRVGTTKYSLRLIPLGGFVRMAGDDFSKYYAEGNAEKITVEPVSDDSDMDIESKAIANNRKNWFFEKNLLRRSSIVFAGPLFNLLYAWIVLVFVFMFYGVGDPVIAPKIGGLIPDYPAEVAGLREGDFIKSINDVEIESWEQVVKTIASFKGAPVNLKVIRTTDNSSEVLDLSLQPKVESAELALMGGDGKSSEPRYLIGILQSYDKRSIGFIQASVFSVDRIAYFSWQTLKSIWYLIAGQISSKNIGGPITIMKETAKSAERGLEGLLLFTVFISISLAVMNLLPIPVLDGGHLLFFLLEGIRGKRLNIRFMEYATQFGMFLLMGLMIYALWNDLSGLAVKYL
jgi:regulator of sigma E protease